MSTEWRPKIVECFLLLYIYQSMDNDGRSSKHKPYKICNDPILQVEFFSISHNTKHFSHSICYSACITIHNIANSMNNHSRSLDWLILLPNNRLFILLQSPNQNVCLYPFLALILTYNMQIHRIQSLYTWREALLKFI